MPPKGWLLPLIGLAAATPAAAQFFSAPALQLSIIVGTKAACAARFPDLRGRLDQAFDSFAARHKDRISPEGLPELTEAGRGSAGLMADVTAAHCEDFIAVLPQTSLQEAVNLQAHIEEDRRNDERARRLLQDGKGRRSYLGVDIAASHEARVAAVAKGSPAEAAGIRPGDLIVAYDGKPIRRPAELALAVLSTDDAHTVEIELLRGTQKLSTKAVIAKIAHDARDRD